MPPKVEKNSWNRIPTTKNTCSPLLAAFLYSPPYTTGPVTPREFLALPLVNETVHAGWAPPGQHTPSSPQEFSILPAPSARRGSRERRGRGRGGAHPGRAAPTGAQGHPERHGPAQSPSRESSSYKTEGKGQQRPRPQLTAAGQGLAGPSRPPARPPRSYRRGTGNATTPLPTVSPAEATLQPAEGGRNRGGGTLVVRICSIAALPQPRPPPAVVLPGRGGRHLETLPGRGGRWGRGKAGGDCLQRPLAAGGGQDVSVALASKAHARSGAGVAEGGRREVAGRGGLVVSRRAPGVLCEIRGRGRGCGCCAGGHGAQWWP